MSIEELCGLSAEDWEKFSIEKLQGILQPYLKVTRPETGRLPDKTEKTKFKMFDDEVNLPKGLQGKPKAWIDSKKREAAELLKMVQKEMKL